MRESGGWRAFAMLACAAAVAGAGVVGCGSSSDAEPEQMSEADKAPKAKGDPDAVIEKLAATLARAKKSKDCAVVDELNKRSMQPLACPTSPKLRKSMGKFKVTDVAVYGSGAVVDYRSGGAPDGASATLYVDRNKNWSIGGFGLLYGPTVGTRAARSKPVFDRTMNGYLRAVAKRNCKQYSRYAATTSGNLKQVCKEDFTRTSLLGLALKANPSAKPAYLGGNRTIGFYNIRLPKPSPRYYTLSVISVPGAKGKQTAVVLNAANGPAPKPKLPTQVAPTTPPPTTTAPSPKPTPKPSEPAPPTQQS